jgi:hypothetical protein
MLFSLYKMSLCVFSMRFFGKSSAGLRQVVMSDEMMRHGATATRDESTDDLTIAGCRQRLRRSTGYSTYGTYMYIHAYIL